ncbi:hypothetical protein QGX11_gp035 [Pseudomonas phage PPSC2]|uniref:Uncharacterized protein n=1 Tax=Pseudomonas phage PPSC2 TaxID=2041350 RepID=A0A2R2YAK0_9CAUD|nr:hypothetical protein QGX11_gp035 [Pseudomonas phage PPSC2]ATN92798.1 hypothetical protein PPSC2_35 [Pseudomonas phage PPSC2]
MWELFEKYPEALEELNYQIARNNLDCADNYRIAIVGNDEQMADYEDKRAHGCCGDFDIRVTIGENKFDIGCNYGH